MLPLSLRKNIPSYKGKLMRIIKPQRTICTANSLKPLTSESITTHFRPLTKLKRLMSASVDKMVNIGEVVPNSMISLLYLCETYFSETFDVMIKLVVVNPIDFKITSQNPKRYEVNLLYNHILWSFHQPFTVPPK